MRASLVCRAAKSAHAAQRITRSGRNLDDTWTKQAKTAGYVARSAYKLLEIQEKHKLIPPGGNVLDLGCHPGAWLQARPPAECACLRLTVLSHWKRHSWFWPAGGLRGSGPSETRGHGAGSRYPGAQSNPLFNALAERALAAACSVGVMASSSAGAKWFVGRGSAGDHRSRQVLRRARAHSAGRRTRPAARVLGATVPAGEACSIASIEACLPVVLPDDGGGTRLA